MDRKVGLEEFRLRAGLHAMSDSGGRIVHPRPMSRD